MSPAATDPSPSRSDHGTSGHSRARHAGRRSRPRPEAGRHRQHARPGRTRILVIAAAVLPAATAVAGAAAYEAQAATQPRLTDPVASSVASYYLRPPKRAAAATQASGHSRLTGSHPATSPRPGASEPAGHRSPGTAASPGRTSGAAASPSPSASGTSAAKAAVSCAGTAAGGTGMLPLNYVTIVDYLLAHGYGADAAAGVAGNIYQESKGNPESVGSGGGGLIGWTPLPSGFVTGDAAADLETQLGALLTYNEGWAQYIPLLNAATSAADAAYVYMTYFERPGIPAASNREDAAVAVAQACGFGS